MKNHLSLWTLGLILLAYVMSSCQQESSIPAQLTERIEQEIAQSGIWQKLENSDEWMALSPSEKQQRISEAFRDKKLEYLVSLAGWQAYYDLVGDPIHKDCLVQCSTLVDHIKTKNNRIPLEKARLSVRLFGRFQKTMDQVFEEDDNSFYDIFLDKMPHAFFIPKENIDAIARGACVNGRTSELIGARVYLGTVPEAVHLYMVPVDKDSNDVMCSDSLGQYAYNFITPCPKVCDASESPESLNAAFKCGYSESAWSMESLIENPCIPCFNAPSCLTETFSSLSFKNHEYH